MTDSNEEKLIKALKSGPIRAIGGIVYDSTMSFLMSTTDLCHAIRSLGCKGIRINRLDAGGSPKWALDIL